MYGHGTEIINMTKCVENCGKPATIRSDEDQELRCAACAHTLVLKTALTEERDTHHRYRVVAAAIIAALVLALLSVIMAYEFQSAPASQPPVQESAPAAPAAVEPSAPATPKEWKIIACEAKEQGATRRELVSLLVDDYSSTPLSARRYVRYVYPKC